jgi:hypothetical protein
MPKTQAVKLAFVILVLALVVGCAAGENNDWTEADPAGFFAGLWHGALLLIALIVSFFTDEVTIYEVANNGTWYHIGYVLGILAVYGGGTKVSCGKSRRAKERDREEWDRIAAKFEAKVKAFLSDEDELEKKLKARIRKWLEEDEPGEAPPK